MAKDSGPSASPFTVLEVWQHVTGRRLSSAHRREFFERDEVARLAVYGRRELEASGRSAVTTLAGKGAVLRLDKWLAALEQTDRPTPPLNQRLNDPSDLFAPDLLGSVIAGPDIGVVRRSDLVDEVLKYSRFAIRQACSELPRNLKPSSAMQQLLLTLRKSERRFSQLNYDPLADRSDRFDHRPPPPPAGRTW